MNAPELPKLVPIPPTMRRFGSGTMLIPSPREVQAVIREVPNGSVMTLTQMREHLAAKHHADITCPLTTGIFVHIVAEAAEESAAAGNADITPYWRVVKNDGSLDPKFPGGVTRQAERLREEGHRVVAGNPGKPPRVADIVLADAR